MRQDRLALPQSLERRRQGDQERGRVPPPNPPNSRGRRPTRESPEGVAHGAEAEDDVQVVPHALDEVGEEAVRGLWHLLSARLVYDERLDLVSAGRQSEGGGFQDSTQGGRDEGTARDTGCGF